MVGAIDVDRVFEALTFLVHAEAQAASDLLTLLHYAYIGRHSTLGETTRSWNGCYVNFPRRLFARALWSA